MRTLPVVLLAAFAALLLAMPTAALAQAEPDMMEDPVEAMEPEIDVADPVAPAAGDETGGVAAQNDIPAVEGLDEQPQPAAATAGAATAPSATVTAGSGQLPFTGLDSRQLLQLFLVGSVLVSGGIVSIAWGRARSQMA